ncbi:hypothetical protein F5887DRAFT_1076188 [Amanita rubescens]|nr:hypothetical protein F5887DRAFT_1076188 [Amanita rubescens]
MSFVEVYIVAVILQALLTGAYFATFLMCLRWLVFSDDGVTLRKGINWPLLSIAIIFFTFSVVDLGISAQTMLLISEDRSGKANRAVIAYFIEMLTPIITDGVLIFRCWIVYNRSWRIAVLPLLLLLYNISSLLMMAYWTSPSSGVASPSFLNRQLGIQESYYASTIVINIYATSAIILKIWRNSFSRRLSQFAIRIITESGLLYTFTTIATFCVLFLNHDTAFVVTSAINFPTALIAYNLILIRVAQNRASQEPELPTFIGNSTIERVVPIVPCYNSETVA